MGFLAAKTHGGGPGYEEAQSRAKIIRWQGLTLRGLVHSSEGNTVGANPKDWTQTTEEKWSPGHSLKESLLEEAPLCFMCSHLSEQALRMPYTGQEFPLVAPMALRFCFNVSRNRKQMTLQTIVMFRKF